MEEVGTAEVGTAEVGTGEEGTAEVGTLEVGTGEVGTDEVDVLRKLKPPQITLLAVPCVPQPFNMRRIERTRTTNPESNHAEDSGLHMSFPR